MAITNVPPTATSGDSPRAWLEEAWRVGLKCDVFSRVGLRVASWSYGGRMARLPRYVFSDGHFHVAARGAGRIAIYRDDDDCRVFLGLLATIARKHDWTVHAVCLMTNHYHLVLEATVAQLSAGFQRLNGRYAQGFNARHGRWGHLFGERFWSGAIEDEEELVAVCRYVIANPVRAGLVRRAADWPWSGWRYGPLGGDGDDDEAEEHERDHTVHGEERGVEPAEVRRPDERMLVEEEQPHRRDTEPVRDADVEAQPSRRKQPDRRHVEEPRARERSASAEAGRDRVKPLRPVDIHVEEGVEEIEACDPARDGAAERPRLPRELTGDRSPRAHRRQPVDDAEPDVAQPGPPRQVGIDDEAGERDRPEPADDGIELHAREQVQRKRERTETGDLRA